MRSAGGLIVALVIMAPYVLQAQQPGHRFEAGVQLALANPGEFDEVDSGVGGRVAWTPRGMVGFEAEVTVFPRAYSDGRAFSRRRVEGLFGLTVGPTLGRVRPFGRVRTGFLRFGEAPGRGFPCIRIYPEPLACALASGDTVTAVDLGGGLEVNASPRFFLRADVGDRVVRYSGPVMGRDRIPHEKAFFSHDLRLAVGAGVRF